MTTIADGTTWAFGDSLTAGTWLEHPQRDCWVSRLNLRIGGDSCHAVSNRGVGGLGLHNPDGSTTNTLGPVVAAALAVSPPPLATLILVGTNDLISHDLRAMPDPVSQDNSKWAMIAVDLQLQNAGVATRLWCTILPRGHGSAQPDAYLAELEQRRRAFNTWMRAMWGPKGQLVDLDGVLEEDGTSGLVVKPHLIDGLHPNQWGAVRVSDAMPKPNAP